MQTNEVAKRYAAAIAALEGADLAALEADLKAVQDSFAGSTEVKNFFDSPRIDDESKKKIISKAFDGKISQTALNFLFLLIDKRRESQLGPIYREFVLHNDRVLGRVRVELLLSRDLVGDSDQDSLYKDVKDTILAKRKDFGIPDGDVNLIIEKKVNPEILGGMIIRVGDYLLNSSVRRYINKWKQNVSIQKFNIESVWQE